jgi:hypothetical protein
MTDFTAPLYVSGAPVLPGGSVGPFTGNWWFVSPATGSDGNTGAANSPLASLAQAQINAVANNGDVVVLLGTNHTTKTIPWAKNGVHLIGMTAPSNDCRARVSSTGATAFSPLVNVTGAGCLFANISAFHGGFTGATGSQVCWNDAGGYSGYSGVQFLGGGDATTAALAGMRSLTLTGGGENVFSGCTVGLDTIIRATNANASLELISGTARNRFIRTLFQSYVSDASDVHVKVGAGGMDRFCSFEDCVFHNFGTAMTAAITNAGGSPGGDIMLNPNCISVGAAAIATTGNVFVGQISAAGATTTGIGIPAT